MLPFLGASGADNVVNLLGKGADGGAMFLAVGLAFWALVSLVLPGGGVGVSMGPSPTMLMFLALLALWFGCQESRRRAAEARVDAALARVAQVQREAQEQQRLVQQRLEELMARVQQLQGAAGERNSSDGTLRVNEAHFSL